MENVHTNTIDLDKRCKYSSQFKEQFNYVLANENREGTIIREANNGRCWVVLWDGRETVDYIGKSFIEIIESEIVKMIRQRNETPYEFQYYPDSMEDKNYAQQ